MLTICLTLLSLTFNCFDSDFNWFDFYFNWFDCFERAGVGVNPWLDSSRPSTSNSCPRVNSFAWSTLGPCPPIDWFRLGLAPEVESTLLHNAGPGARSRIDTTAQLWVPPPDSLWGPVGCFSGARKHPTSKCARSLILDPSLASFGCLWALFLGAFGRTLVWHVRCLSMLHLGGSVHLTRLTKIMVVDERIVVTMLRVGGSIDCVFQI